MNLGGKVQLVIANVLGNLYVLFVSNSLSNIPAWNWKVDEYIVAIFDFTNKFSTFDGAVLLFHQDDFKILKEVKSYLESYGFYI
jgi:hypothetical protein